MINKIIALLLIIMVGTASIAIAENNITMGYKELGKMPLISSEKTSSGLYKELFEKAAKNIGYQLKIVRIPKKRVHKGLADGTIDFYPGASFSKKRAGYLYYLPNGLKTKEVLVSPVNQPQINDMSEANGRLLVELGSSKVEWGKKYPGLEIVQISRLPMETVIKVFKKGRGDFYIADIEVVDYYKKTNRINDYKDIGIKIHQKAINAEFIPMYLGFSRKSVLFEEQANSTYDVSKGVAIDNPPTKIRKDCVAYKFYLALEELSKSGETQKMYDRYFK